MTLPPILAALIAEASAASAEGRERDRSEPGRPAHDLQEDELIAVFGLTRPEAALARLVLAGVAAAHVEEAIARRTPALRACLDAAIRAERAGQTEQVAALVREARRLLES